MPPQPPRRDWTTFSPVDSDAETINDFIKFKTKEYDEYGLRNDDLWETFKEDFEKFTEDKLKSANPTLLRILRNQLRKYGVWINNQRRANVAEALYETLKEEDPVPWTATEIQECLDAGEVFDSRRIDNVLNKHNAGKTTTPTPSTTTPTPSIPVPTPPTDTPEYVANPQQSGTKQGTEQPPEQQQQEYGKELATLIRLYTDDTKYSGENDNFDFKLKIFHDFCRRANIPDHAKMIAFPTMLRSLALDHYYANIVDKHLNFDEICNAITNHFEGPEYKRRVLSKWNSTSL